MSEHKDRFTQLLTGLKNQSQFDLSVMFLAKIDKLNPPTADITPIAKVNKQKQPQISKAHFMIQPTYKRVWKLGTKDDAIDKNDNHMYVKKLKLDYKVGDTVLVGCLDLDNSNFSEKGYSPTTERKHAIDYAVILGRYARKSDFKGGDD